MAFTTDGQAGLGADAGAFVAQKPASAIDVRIQPVSSPPGLPRHYALDGNAYRFTATGRPGKRRAKLTRPITIVLRWPHAPVALYVYAGGHWQVACTARQWQLNGSLVLCRVKTLGTFAALRAR